ncbi:MAG: 3-oxoacyl-[acyl-carrier-protein] reductase [Hyphomicrobiales bacterium]|jgi:3-oxoacyl-[acyl-carrier protein] reductase|nr:3-oxoacyl-[acyl-carrier-protein] reductase [Hyphomicrobiales bacterium]|tara:strand:- start:137 stop:874 length:738 start_codon:yes stop_codon:yes gene_type:complete
MTLLEGKTVLLTGSTGSLGSAIARTLSSAGARIALTGTNNEKLNNLLMELGSSHSAHSCDLSKFEEIDKLSDTVIEEFGSIDILINNAGVKKDDLLIRMKDDDWFNVININLNSVYKLTKNISKHMFKKRSGKIISISSVVGFSGNPGQTNYVSSKAALVGFTKSLAMEVATRGINVNCIAPGMIDSEMIDSLNEKQKENILSRIPMAKLGSPEDIANACLFLGSDMSNYITGQTIHVNGGMAML